MCNYFSSLATPMVVEVRSTGVDPGFLEGEWGFRCVKEGVGVAGLISFFLNIP